MTKKKSTAKIVKKKVTKKKAAKKPAAKKKAAVRKAPVKKKASAKKGAKKAVSPEQRYMMVRDAAYYLAEKSGFTGSSVEHWIQAEKQIKAQLKKK